MGPDPVRDMEPREAFGQRSPKTPSITQKQRNEDDHTFPDRRDAGLLGRRSSRAADVHHQGDDVFFAKTSEELTGENFVPDDIDSLAAGDNSITLTAPTWVRTKSARHQAQAILLAPESAA